MARLPWEYTDHERNKFIKGFRTELSSAPATCTAVLLSVSCKRGGNLKSDSLTKRFNLLKKRADIITL